MSAAELIACLVMQCGLPVDYVMDRMEMYEWEIFTSHHQLSTREEWEQTRFLGYMIANSNPFRKTELPLRKIMKFPWDEDAENEGRRLTDEEAAELARKAKEFEKLINGQRPSNQDKP